MRNYGIHEWREALDFIMSIMPILAPILAIGLVLIVVALINLSKKDLPMSDKILWILIVVLAPTIGPIFYFTIGSKQLDDKIANKEECSH